MKYYHIRSNGNLPPMIQGVVDKVNGQPATRDNFFILDSEISFMVVDCDLCYGNTNKGDKSGWLYSKENGGNLWNVNFDVK